MAPLKITVITDTHYYSPETGTKGKAYEAALMRSQKLLGGSREVLQAAFDKIAADTTSDILLIAGDVSNDGEKCAHEEFREMLRELKEKGKQIFVMGLCKRVGAFFIGYPGEDYAHVNASFGGKAQCRFHCAVKDKVRSHNINVLSCAI